MDSKNNLKGMPKGKIIQGFREMEKAIKVKCYDCMGGQKKVDCELEDCSLYCFRPWSKK